MEKEYRISDKNVEEIAKNYRKIPEREWLRLIFCELHEIKSLLKSEGLGTDE